MTLPVGWNLYKNETTIILYKPIINNFNIEENKKQLVIEKQIVFKDDLSIDFYVNKFCIQPESIGMIKLTYPINIECITQAIITFDWKLTCQGGPKPIDYPGINNNTFSMLP